MTTTSMLARGCMKSSSGRSRCQKHDANDIPKRPSRSERRDTIQQQPLMSQLSVVPGRCVPVLCGTCVGHTGVTPVLNQGEGLRAPT